VTEERHGEQGRDTAPGTEFLDVGKAMWGLTGARPGLRMAFRFARRTAMSGVFVASHLARRNRRLWLLGNHKGFRDNPRYLAEHLIAEHPEIEVWWQARTRPEAEAARAAGLKVVMRGSRASSRLHLRAGVAFLCSGFMDLRVPRLGGAYIVHLYHGTALKRISLDVDFARFVPKSRFLRWYARRQHAGLASRHRRVSLVVAAGRLAKQRFETAFALPPERIRVLGTPRFDVIQGGPAYDRVAGGDLRERLGLQPDDHVVLWLPTWREAGDAGWLPAVDSAAVDAAFGGSNVKMLVKPHPYADFDVYRQRLPESPTLRLLREDDIDVNCLLRLADTLVTDYSSAIFDYALLHRPIHFFAPDADTYAEGRGFYEPFEQLTDGRHHASWQTLLPALRNAAQGSDADGLAMAERIAQRAGNCEEPGNCERIYRAVAEAVGLDGAEKQPA
jgi:CDP-glycerol glycerophosphotransferase (TagB/SpsB family)